MSKEFWNERYAEDELTYGDAPNAFLASMRSVFPSSGTALDIAAGQGRNAVFLASLGLDVLAVDQSEVGLRVARQLAEQQGVPLRTQTVDLAEYHPADHSFDAITSIFAHLPEALRTSVLQSIKAWLRPGGVFVLEAYAPDQIERDTGGPKDPSMLASVESIISELEGLTIKHSASLVRNVIEGKHHSGDASVVQIVARKPLS